MSPGHRLLKYAATVLGLTLVIGASVFAYRAFWLTSTASWPRQQFTPEAWRAAAPDARYAYWNDLESRRLLIGRTRAEVESLLDEPDFDGKEYVTYGVKLADPREFSFNFVYLLHVDLDGAGRVSKAWVRAK